MASKAKRPVLQLLSNQAVLTGPQEIRDVENMHSKQRCQRLPYGYQATDHFKKPVVHYAACMPEDGENHSSSHLSTQVQGFCRSAQTAYTSLQSKHWHCWHGPPLETKGWRSVPKGEQFEK
jgi:hypothetical protein